MATNNKMTLLEQLGKYVVEKDKDFSKEALTLLINALTDAEVTSIIGAEKYERNEERNNCRNGYRQMEWGTRVGTLQLNIPKLRQGSYFPSLSEPRKMSGKALLNVAQEAYVHGVGTRKADELVEALGMKGMDKSEVSGISKQPDNFVEEFKNRRLDGEYPYLWLDAAFPKVREGSRICSMALVIATGVNRHVEREILSCDVGMSEDEAFWEEFLRKLAARGLKGVRLDPTCRSYAYRAERRMAGRTPLFQFGIYGKSYAGKGVYTNTCGFIT